MNFQPVSATSLRAEQAQAAAAIVTQRRAIANAPAGGSRVRLFWLNESGGYMAGSIHSTDASGKAEIDMFSLPSEYCTARLL